MSREMFLILIPCGGFVLSALVALVSARLRCPIDREGGFAVAGVVAVLAMMGLIGSLINYSTVLPSQADQRSER